MTFRAVAFPVEVDLIPLDAENGGRGLFRVHRAFTVTVFGLAIVIGEGFESDGSSIPGWARALFDPWGCDGLPGVLHDWLLKTADWPKWLIDAVFYLALRSQGAGELHAALMYLAVRTRRRG